MTATGVFTVTARPTITSLSPSSKARGTAAQNITMTGANFVSGVNVSISRNGITIVSVTRNSATSITVRLSVSGSANTGFRNVTVTNPDGGTFTLNNGLRIT